MGSFFSSCEPEEPEENITHMDVSLYTAAAEGNIEEFNNTQGLQLESLKTRNHDNVLHVNLATEEIAARLFKRFSSILNFLPVLYEFFPVEYVPFYRSLSIFITMIRGEKRSDFIEKILSKCPSLLLQTNAKGQTPLHVAARNGHSAIVKLLIKSCAKARYGDLEMQGMNEENAVRKMLRIRDQESNTALHEAARCGNVEAVKALLEIEDPSFEYSANKKQETPLYIAAKKGDGGVLSVLLDKSTSTALGGPHGRTVLHAAAMAGDAKAVKVILEKKKDLTKERDEDGYTPLHYAAHLGFKSVVEKLLKKDLSVAYIGDRKRGMTPVLMAARQGYLETVIKILSLCLDCCENVDNKSLNLLHYLAFRGPASPLGRSLFKRGGIAIVHKLLRNLMEEEGAFGMTPQEVYSVLRSEKHHQKQEQIKQFLGEIENDQVADELVIRFGVRNISTESLEKTKNAHLVVAALIATVAFAAAITVPGGLQSEKGSEQGTPLLIDETAFKAFVVTNAMAFIFSVSALTTHFGVLDNLLSQFSFWRETVLYRTWSVSGILGYATVAMMIAFSTGSYVVLKPSHELVIVSYLIGPVFFLCMWVILN
ncbi:ankyrin repeat-containing protein [Gossypium australe]|uniref:Ankyrin repeat-containing protein n=1 Tax=Gossypium australe TaxID=47621 RepID=A0A5B6V2U2_9ROSI|nr:ankyrin repeat-containing protein [Gossypium australe]